MSSINETERFIHDIIERLRQLSREADSLAFAFSHLRHQYSQAAQQGIAEVVGQLQQVVPQAPVQAGPRKLHLVKPSPKQEEAPATQEETGWGMFERIMGQAIGPVEAPPQVGGKA
jgi:hypothetical protein